MLLISLWLKANSCQNNFFVPSVNKGMTDGTKTDRRIMLKWLLCPLEPVAISALPFLASGFSNLMKCDKH